MEINEIKKALYKQKPEARIIQVSASGILYEADCETATARVYSTVYFLVPISEMGDSHFLKDMPAQLLIRYIITEPNY